MAARNYSNTAQDTTLNGAITDVATTATVTADTGWPAAPFTILIESEVILVGARTGTSLSSLTRGYDGTVAASHADATAVKVVVVAQDFEDVPTNLSDLSDVGTASPSDGQVLTYSTGSGEWGPATSSGGGATEIAPNSISGLQVWLRASDMSLADGSAVSQWDDESGNANHFTQGTAEKQPTYETNEINGLAVVRFDNTDDGLDSSVSITAAPYTIGYVAKYNSPSTSAERRVINGSNNWLMGPYSTTWTVYNGQFPSGDTNLYNVGNNSATTGQWVFHIMQRNSNSTMHLVRAVDGLPWDYMGVTGGATHPGTLCMAASTAASFSQVADCDVAEVFYWNTAVSSGDIDGLWEYVKNRYRA